ncbi:hypothetical protein SAMN04487783_0153 [Agrococcus baldri]|uniref:Lipoprotein n=1 Tax=Agrococcus baldri TaxID=153730 RepID=A0AA94HJW7_9MICO|nr:hypothetical protein [Agrococcus baldri]SFR97869.1 hypothetical protein SAMN04487783_0153 [Agrococcus baldri]
MRRAAAGAIALSVVLGGCAMQDDSLIELTPTQAAAAYRDAICRVLQTDGDVGAALTSDDHDAVFEAARARAEVLSNRGITVSEQHEWPAGAEAVWQVDEALSRELSWVLAVAGASSTAAARAVPRPDLAQRASLDQHVRAALALPADDVELCR